MPDYFLAATSNFLATGSSTDSSQLTLDKKTFSKKFNFSFNNCFKNSVIMQHVLHERKTED